MSKVPRIPFIASIPRHMILVITEMNVIISNKNHLKLISLFLSRVGASVAPSQDNLNLLLCLH